MIRGRRRLRTLVIALVLAFGAGRSLALALDEGMGAPVTPSVPHAAGKLGDGGVRHDGGASSGGGASATTVGSAADGASATDVLGEGSKTGEPALAGEPAPILVADAHVQDVGWMEGLGAGELLGTTARGLRLEALRLRVMSDGDDVSGAIEYRAHVEDVGWQGWVSDGDTAGTTNRRLKVEAVRIRLGASLAERYDVWYQAHVEGIGWMAPAKDGASVGTTGRNLRLEALRVWLVDRVDGSSSAPADAEPSDVPASENAEGLSLRAHVSGIGWQGWVGEGATAGTTGRALGLEALCVSTDNLEAGGVRVCAHVSDVGWQDWVTGGEVAGTTGRALPVEALRIEPALGLQDAFDVCYRVHVGGIGWLGWARNGEVAGSVGLALPVEAVQARLVAKGEDAPDAAGAAVDAASLTPSALSCSALVSGEGWGDEVSGGVVGTVGRALPIEGIRARLSGVIGGSIDYRTHVSEHGWQEWGRDGAASGHAGEGLSVEAVQMRLLGTVANVYDVWYRCHVGGYGWLGWARNGETAGSTGAAMPVEAVEARLVRKGAPAPGTTAYHELSGRYVSGDLELDSILWNLIRTRLGTGAQGLRNAYDYVRAFPYRTMNTYPGGTWVDWSIPYAKELYHTGSGNCYRYASLVTWLARALGYDAVAISGNAGTRSGGLTAHSWCEVHLDGGTYVIDCSFGSATGAPQYDWCLTTYAAAHARYHTLGGTRIL